VYLTGKYHIIDFYYRRRETQEL